MPTSLNPTPTPHNLLIQMSGAPGSGKSTLAALLRQSIGGVIIDHDVLKSSLLDPFDGLQGLDFDIAASHAYNLQWALAEIFIKQDIGLIIIDSPCNYPDILDQGRGLAERFGYTY